MNCSLLKVRSLTPLRGGLFWAPTGMRSFGLTRQAVAQIIEKRPGLLLDLQEEFVALEGASRSRRNETICAHP